MADGQVTVTLSVQDAEALRAWQRGKQGIGEMGQELSRTKRAASDVGRATKGIADEMQKLTQFAKTQSPFAKGLVELARQKTEIEEASKAADAHWQKQIAIARAAKKTADASGQTADATQRTGGFLDGANHAATRLISSFGGMLAGALSVQKVIATVRAEYDALVQRGKAAAGFQVDLAGAQRAALRNLSGKELTPKQLNEMLGGVQSRTGAEAKALWSGASQVLSARGNLSERQALEELEAVALADPSMQGDELALSAGAALDLRKRYGGDARQAFGAMLTSQQTSRLTTTQDFAVNAVPALVGLGNLGNSYRESSALYATVTQESADVSGRRSGNAVIRFAQQLEEATPFLPKGTSTLQRRDWLMSGDPEAEPIRRRLLGSMRHDVDEAETAEAAESDPTRKAELHAEAKQWTTILGLLEKGSAAAKALAEQMAATPEYAKAGVRFERTSRLSETSAF